MKMPRNSTKPSEAAGHGLYEARLDPDVRAFIARTNDWYPPEALDLPIGKQREIYNAMCRAFHAGTPEGVDSRDGTIQLLHRELAIRRYRLRDTQPRAVILYYHGGGFVLGDLESHDDVCAGLCAGSGYEVISTDYRLAPEHLHPAAFDDACAIFDWAASNIRIPLLLCGESAGGNLAAAVAHARRGHSRAAIGQVLIYPSLGSGMRGRSYLEHAEAPMLTVRDLEIYRRMRIGGAESAKDPRSAPLDDLDFARLPSTVIFTAECDPLSSDGELYRDRIMTDGGRAHWCEEQGLVHSFLRARTTSPRAQQAFERIMAAITALGKGEWPY
jgi:acetyl esterase